MMPSARRDALLKPASLAPLLFALAAACSAPAERDRTPVIAIDPKPPGSVEQAPEPPPPVEPEPEPVAAAVLGCSDLSAVQPGSAYRLAAHVPLQIKVSSSGKVALPGPILFAAGTAKLLPDSDMVLQIVKKYLQQKPEISMLRIEGHTDSQGSDVNNMAMSRARAMAVACKLVSEGVHCARLMPVGFGEIKPLATNRTAAGRAANRRIDFVNAMLRGRAIGGLPADGGGEVAGDPCQ